MGDDMMSVLKTLADPATNVGTARWVALGVTAYDAMRHGVNLANGAVLLVLAGVDVAARYFEQRQPPTMPPMPPGAPA